MGSNGIVTERAVHNVNKSKYDENYERIFGNKSKEEIDKRIRIDKVINLYKTVIESSNEIWDSLSLMEETEIREAIDKMKEVKDIFSVKSIWHSLEFLQSNRNARFPRAKVD